MPKELFDEEAEVRLLGAAFCHVEAAEIVFSEVQEAHLYYPRHRELFSAMKSCWDRGEVLDEISVTPQCKGPQDVPYDFRILVGRCIMQTSPAAVESYIERVRELALGRLLDKLGDTIKASLKEVGPLKAYEGVRRQIEVIDNRLGGVTGGLRDMQEIADELIKDAVTGKQVQFSGLACGVAGGCLDALMDGWGRKQLILVSAITGQGKSTFLDAVVRGIRQNNPDKGEPIIFSTENSIEAVARKALASVTGLWTRTIKRRQLTDLEKSDLISVKNTRKLAGVKTMFVNGMKPAQLELIAMQHKRRAGLPMMVVDLAAELGGTGKDEREKIVYLMGELARLKDKLDTCIVAAVQPNRAANENADGEPQLQNLAGSSQWEKGADKVVFLHRPGQKDGSGDKRTKVSVAKDREDGELGHTWIEYDRWKGAFKDANFKEEKK